MANEILTVAQCYEADRYAEASGVSTLTLMENAGRAVADAICSRWTPRTVAVLCGRGNNGGDGFVAARYLKTRGWDVRLALLGRRDSLEGDAAEMARRWDHSDESVSPATLEDAGLVIDAMFGAGLSRPLEGPAKDIATALNTANMPVVAVDVPSGLHGDLGKPLGDLCVNADLTVTFFRKKQAHVLMPGRSKCGAVVVADIGIPSKLLETIRTRMFENGPAIWHYPWPDPAGYKYSRGHCVVVSGPAYATGAARLAARGALRAGAGLVSIASPEDALAVNASELTAIMIKPVSGANELSDLLKDERLNSVVIGPGCGIGRPTQDMVASVLASKAAAVLDADALTSFKDKPSMLFLKLRENTVLTPHEGEFKRIFSDLLDRSQNRIEAVRAAAATAHCTVLLKGADTVIASPDGRAVVNTNAPPTLATAGSGDVLSGIIGGLLAQGMDSFDAACAGVWLHGEAANCFGIGLIAEDIPEMLPRALRELQEAYPPTR